MIAGWKFFMILIMKIEIQKYKLNFRFEAGTSRGVMKSKDTYFLKLYHHDNPGVYGIGECGPLTGLSPDLEGNLDNAIVQCISTISDTEDIVTKNVTEIVPKEFPALQFAVETAILDLHQGGNRHLFSNDFSNSISGISINGLVWMGEKALMLQRIEKKINEGFKCIKIKIGAIQINEELELLKFIRRRYSKDQITIRLDANGAFNIENALRILDQLAKFDIHSIEQPIMAGNWDAMEKICSQSPIPIALDEELIGIYDKKTKIHLLEKINPAYIILKPTLLGGLQKCKEWIELAEERSIGWWITSALESNIGLNAIAQFTANFPVKLPQGLGTGQLFHNNISSPLIIDKGYLKYDTNMSWDLSIPG